MNIWSGSVPKLPGPYRALTSMWSFLYSLAAPENLTPDLKGCHH